MPADLIAAAIGMVLTLMVTLAWAYLASMTVGGWLAGEQPNRAWGLGALAATYLLPSPRRDAVEPTADPPGATPPGS